MAQLALALLGPPNLTVNSQPIKTDRRKAIALLAYLAVTARPAARADLAALLWPDYAPESAYAYLRRTLWELNQVLGKGWLEADREQVALAAEGLWLDVAAFRAGLRAPAADVAALEAALALYRGEFLAGFVVPDTAPFEAWQAAQAETLRREFAGGLQRFVEALAQAGDIETALAQARRWLALDPLHEPAHRALMRLLAKTGDRAGALRQYDLCAAALSAELRVAPEAETTALAEAIRRGELAPAGQPPAQAAPVPVPETTLPTLATPFIGRRAEVEQIKALVLDPAHRIVTLLGMGGTGKTRLSIQAATELRAAFAGGVFFAPLAAVPTAAAVLPAVAKALQFSFYREGESHRQQLLDFVREKQLLLILDNFEHLLEAAALAADLVAHAPGLKLLVTSRTRLNLPGEQLYPVSGMRLPAAAESDAWDDPEEQSRSYSAVQLFLERARRVRPDFALTRANLQPVLAICRLAQGVPLALELAAAWLELLPPSEIAAELARSLDFLETDQAGVPDRQRSLRAVFESSWKLLSPAERGAFQQLCVFRGSFSRAAAQHVTGADLRTLLGLANKSWLQQTAGGRFQLHDLMAQYGTEQLRASPEAWQAAHDQHAAHFVQFAAEQWQRLRGVEQLAGVQALDEEFDTNLRAAWDWLAAQQRWADLTGDLALALLEYVSIRWRQDELIAWLRPVRRRLETLSAPDAQLAYAVLGTFEVTCEEMAQVKDDAPLERLAALWRLVADRRLAEALGGWFVLLASLVTARNLSPEAPAALAAAIERLRRQGDRWTLGKSLMVSADVFHSAQDEAKLREAAQIFAELGGVFERGQAAELLGFHATRHRRPLAEVEQYHRAARAFYAQLGDRSPSGLVHSVLVGAYIQQGEIEQAFATLRAEQLLLERLGNSRLLGHTLHWQSLYAGRYGTYAQALDTRLRSRALLVQTPIQSDHAWQTFELGDVYRIFGELEQAQATLAQAQAQFEALNMTLGLCFCRRAFGDLALRAEHYAEALDHYQHALALAQQDNQAWAMALAHGKVALAHAWLGDCGQARPELRVALADASALGQTDLVLLSLLAEAVCLQRAGQWERAAALAAHLAQHPVSWNETKEQARALLAAAAQHLTAAQQQLAEQRGRELDLEAVVQVLLLP